MSKGRDSGKGRKKRLEITARSEPLILLRIVFPHCSNNLTWFSRNCFKARERQTKTRIRKLQTELTLQDQDFITSRKRQSEHFPRGIPKQSPLPYRHMTGSKAIAEEKPICCPSSKGHRQPSVMPWPQQFSRMKSETIQKIIGSCQTKCSECSICFITLCLFLSYCYEKLWYFLFDASNSKFL